MCNLTVFYLSFSSLNFVLLFFRKKPITTNYVSVDPNARAEEENRKFNCLCCVSWAIVYVGENVILQLHFPPPKLSLSLEPLTL